MGAPGEGARERFKQAVREAGGPALVAKRLGITRAYVDMIRKGTRRPGMRAAHAIERVLSIPMQSWMEAE